jgi:hypothetical protein
MVAPEPFPPKTVSVRSLPDGALQGMRQALNALGGGEDEADASEGQSRSGAASTSMVAALDAEELRRETQLWERMMYKSTSQHKRAVHFQRMRGVTRHVRAVASLDVGAAAAALRDGLRAGVSDEARAAALESPAVKAGAHAIWKLPPRALWEDLAHRLRAVARVASEADDDVLAAATSLEGQLAHTYFMPFALVATSAVARIRAAMHQLMTDAVASYNVLAPLLNGGVLPPPGSDANGAYGTMPESLRCEWSPVRRGVATGAVRPAVHASNPAGPSTGTIDDDDWHWRLLGGSVGVKNTGTYRTDAGQAFGGEDLGAAVERTNVRGLSARVDRGEETNEESKEDEAAAPTYSTAGVGLGLGLDAGALTAAMRPPDLTATTDAKSGGKKRRKVSASGTAPAVPSESIAPKHDGDGQKKKKKKKKGGAAPLGDDGAKPPMSAMDRAMAVLMGGK